ncbi:MAG: DUF4402 domain-containing protein [Massilia sp.]
MQAHTQQRSSQSVRAAVLSQASQFGASAGVKLALLAGLFTGAVLSMPGAHAANATANATSTVVAPIAIVKAADLSFGKFAATTGGSVTISTTGVRTNTPGVVQIGGGTLSAARFDVTGETDATFSIAITSSPTLSAGGGNTMAFATVSDLTAGNTVTGNVTSGTLTLGSQSIYVGGILTVGLAQAAGTYTGSVTATVEYN